jgi:hypothetical protein
MKFNWKTEKGNQVEIEMKKVKIDKTADGYKYGEEEIMDIESFIANGQKYNASIIKESMHHDYKDVVEFFINNKKMTVIIPEEVSEQIWGEERRTRKEIIEKNEKISKEYEDHVNKMNQIMNQ